MNHDLYVFLFHRSCTKVHLRPSHHTRNGDGAATATTSNGGERSISRGCHVCRLAGPSGLSSERIYLCSFMILAIWVANSKCSVGSWQILLLPESLKVRNLHTLAIKECARIYTSKHFQAWHDSFSDKDLLC